MKKTIPSSEFRSIKLLLIEDDEDDYMLIRSLLSGITATKYQISWTSTYEGALKELHEGDYDVCLMDYRLGSRDGLEILRNVAGYREMPPMIVLTGYGDYDVDMEAMRHGAADYLVKDQINEHLLERSIRYSIERKKTEDALRESEKRLKHLSAQLLAFQENERRKLATELHDNMSQTLIAIKFSIENILTRVSQENAFNHLRELVPMIQGAIEGVRNIYTQLRPSVLDDFGAMAAINWFCREFENTNPSIAVSKELAVSEEEIPDSIKLTIFRIVQESMDNIAAHSFASTASIRLYKREHQIGLRIEDDGDGFDVDAVMSQTHRGGLGLISMKRRAELSGGVLDIRSERGNGTSIHVVWPARK